jgi:hypothetical protein
LRASPRDRGVRAGQPARAGISVAQIGLKPRSRSCPCFTRNTAPSPF